MRAGKRFDVWLPSDLYDALSAQSAQEKRPMRAIVEEYVRAGIARQRGEVLEQQSIPVIREAIASEVGKANVQLYNGLRDFLRTEFTAEMKGQEKKRDDRLAALIVRAIREGGIARRMLYTQLSHLKSPQYAGEIYRDAAEKTGKELARPFREVLPEE